MPTFWLGLLLIMVFAAGVGPIPASSPPRGMEASTRPTGSRTSSTSRTTWCCRASPWSPCVYAQYLLVMRSSLLDEMGQDYLTTARAKGLRDDQVRRRHAVPNALLPTVTLVFIHIGFVVGGAVSVETVFSWPGLGLLFYEAMRCPDFAAHAGDVHGVRAAR